MAPNREGTSYLPLSRTHSQTLCINNPARERDIILSPGIRGSSRHKGSRHDTAEAPASDSHPSLYRPSSGLVGCRLSDAVCARRQLGGSSRHVRSAHVKPVLKPPSCPAAKMRLPPKVLFVRQNETTESTQIAFGAEGVGKGGATYEETALHAAERKSRYPSPLCPPPPLAYCNWGDCGGAGARSGRGRRAGRKAVFVRGAEWRRPLCIPAAHPAEDRVVQPNEILRHASSPESGLTFRPPSLFLRAKRITTREKKRSS